MSKPKSVLIPLVNGFEEIETVTPADLLLRAGAEVVLASLENTAGPITGRCGMRLIPDTTLDEAAGREFDLIFIPGGPGVKALRADARIGALARKHHAAGKPVAAICAAPLVLLDTGILPGHAHTAHFSARAELPHAATEAVVEDGLVITSRGAGTALALGLALVRRLFGDTKAREISDQIMA